MPMTRPTFSPEKKDRKVGFVRAFLAIQGRSASFVTAHWLVSILNAILNTFLLPAHDSITVVLMYKEN